jgi:HPt (histidine-containing phosphotransfer) domain-containing protein
VTDRYLTDWVRGPDQTAAHAGSLLLGSDHEAAPEDGRAADGSPPHVVAVADDIADLVPEFLAYQRDEIQEVAPEDLARVARFAHNLKGSAAGYGFPALGVLAGQLEAAARADQRQEATSLFDQLRVELKLVSEQADSS